MMEAKLIYQNFDGLDVTFQGAFPGELLSFLERSKDEAQARNGSLVINLSSVEGEFLIVILREKGAGGYSYLFDTGPWGAIWMVSKNQDPEKWNIRVSVHSLALALKGYEEVKEEILDTLASLGAIGPQWDEKRQRKMPKERVSRIDYCFDYHVGYLNPDPTHFVAHSKSKKHAHFESIEPDAVYTGSRVQSIRVGVMPNRQVALYLKTKEIAAHGKAYWWDIWGTKSKGFNGEIWRVEARAGKDDLDEWNLKSFADFETKAGDVILGALNAIRYTIPSDDSNRSRWPLHPIWEQSIANAANVLAPYISGADRKKILSGLRSEREQMFLSLIRGSLTSLTALKGLDISELPQTLDAVSEDALSFLKDYPKLAADKFNQAEMRYRSLLDGA
ncbi:MAG: hypothetical protein HQL45_17520 [Alphaproteobacteria bacterium]|nr:hypothetical protein [Alphaproteobacteria bacterium]